MTSLPANDATGHSFLPGKYKKGASSFGPARARGVPGTRAEGAKECTAAMAPKYTAVSARAQMHELPPRRAKGRVGMPPSGTKNTTADCHKTESFQMHNRLSQNTEYFSDVHFDYPANA